MHIHHTLQFRIVGFQLMQLKWSFGSVIGTNCAVVPCDVDCYVEETFTATTYIFLPSHCKEFVESFEL